MSRRARIIAGFSLSLGMLVLLDVAAGWAFCHDGQFREWRLPPFPLLSTPQQAEWLARDDWPYYRFDADLGWTLRAGAVFGDDKYRTNADAIRSDREYAVEKPKGVLRIAAFGDSYVHGDDVDNAETAWAMLESEDSTWEALNFGVPGYGTDQAFLRYRKEAARFHPDVVVIGLMPENIQRNVSVFRPAYYPLTGLPFAKPRFEVTADGSLALIPCPANSLAQLRELIDTGRLTETLVKTDYWVRRSPLAYQGSAWFASSLFRITYAAHANGGRAYRDYYLDSTSEPIRVTEEILNAFSKQALADGASRAVVVLLPDKSSLRGELGRATPSNFWRGLVDRLQARGVECLDLFPTLLDASGRDGVDALFVGTHYNAQGHGLVASAIRESVLGR